MYEQFRPRKPIPLFAHRGRPEDFMHRYARDLEHAFKADDKELDALRAQLPEIITQPENLYVALMHLAKYGGDAPGPDGVRAGELARRDAWEMLHQYSEVLRDGTYAPAKPTIIKRRKRSGGERSIEVANLGDRTVSRGAAQVLAPWLERSFHPHSFGFRKRLGPLHALATALWLAEDHDRYIWLTVDLRDAFGSVPIQRLLDLIGQKFGDRVRSLVSLIIADRRRGLSQGAPLSPALLNFYADKFIDWPWQRKCADIPLLRYADDLLSLCISSEEAECAEGRLSELLLPAGMQFKDDESKGNRRGADRTCQVARL